MSNLVVYPDRPSFIDGTADFIVDLAAQAIGERGSFTIALSGGSTPRPIYARLASAGYRDRIEWSKVHVCFGDERCVPPEDSRSNYRMAREALLDHVPLLPDHIHRIQGEIDPAQAALSYARSNAKELGISDEFFQEHDLHIHVPEGAIPKDGPSAGITMATAMISLFTQRPVRKAVAMTGEITLRGNVLPIGGLKEKLLAARRAKIKTVVIPQLNVKDLDELPAYLKETLQIVPVEEVTQVLENALIPRRATPKHSQRR